MSHARTARIMSHPRSHFGPLELPCWPHVRFLWSSDDAADVGSVGDACRELQPVPHEEGAPPDSEPRAPEAEVFPSAADADLPRRKRGRPGGFILAEATRQRMALSATRRAAAVANEKARAFA